MHTLFLILGGNLGDRVKILELANMMISSRIGSILLASSVYETDAWGFEGLPFLNQVVIVETMLTPHEALGEALAIEKELGRVRLSAGYHERTIDIDLLFYDDICLDTVELQIPHPRIAQRRFVLVPLNEIAPQKKHPATGVTVNEMLQLCDDLLEVKKVN